MVSVLIDSSGTRDAVLAQLAGCAKQVAFARALSAVALAAYTRAHADSIAERDAAIAEHHKRSPNLPLDESKLPQIAAMPPFSSVPHDILDDVADLVAFASTRVAKMGAHPAGCTIRLVPNDHRGGGAEKDGWTASVTFAVYPEIA